MPFSLHLETPSTFLIIHLSRHIVGVLYETVTDVSICRGRPTDEIDESTYNLTNARRRSNSSTHAHDMKNFKTKFETVEPEPVFEEELHGASAVVDANGNYVGGEQLEKESTGSSTDMGSVQGDDEDHKKI
jgi:hypothetical protein